MWSEIPCQGITTILTNHMKGIKVNENINILKHKSCKDKIQRYTRSSKNSLEPERSSTLYNSQLELIYCIRKSDPNSPDVVPWFEWEMAS
jgi:hypothetical protein